MYEINFDETGPAKVLQLYSPKTPLKAVVVVDNTALGPAVGGVRVSPAVSVAEVLRLARTMTLKNAVAGLPHGGAKAGIVADPKCPDMERIFRIFARMIRDLREYIPGPDMGCDETAMAWIQDETGRAVGLPEEIGGLPLDKLGATGFGLAECAEVAAPFAGMELNGSRVAIHGFGSVGKAAARFLTEKGAVLIAAADTGGALYDPGGIELEALLRTKAEKGSVAKHSKGRRMLPEELLSVECDILVPAATPDVIHEGNAATVRARLILQGANIPATCAAEEILAQRGILSVPDFIANAGGVIMAAMEYARKIEQEAFAAIAARIRENTRLIIEKALSEKALPRAAAVGLARARVSAAMHYREY
ncbi:Glu/Leu/Phe/Val dehydrogenase [Geobacter sp.]|uniref:Glu/Leu/Phe/Val family dehydrogenase n=1 Tax=Geobacter sp. TaxID=46610 RepID=UPI002621CF92|nr:Glu/Leu/Phe/Val dehydrogenase [Geobacter sp.]